MYKYWNSNIEYLFKEWAQIFSGKIIYEGAMITIYTNKRTIFYKNKIKE